MVSSKEEGHLPGPSAAGWIPDGTGKWIQGKVNTIIVFNPSGISDPWFARSDCSERIHEPEGMRNLYRLF